jgi:hypothetical protein
MGDYRQGFGLQIGFIDYCNTRIVTTLNYSAIGNLHNLQLTTGCVKSFLPAAVSTSPLVTE